MIKLSSPWAAVDQGLLDRAARVLPLSGEIVELKAGQDVLGFGKYGDEWRVISTMRHDDNFSMVGSCMSGRVVENLLRRLIDASGPKQLALF